MNLYFNHFLFFMLGMCFTFWIIKYISLMSFICHSLVFAFQILLCLYYFYYFLFKQDSIWFFFSFLHPTLWLSTLPFLTIIVFYLAEVNLQNSTRDGNVVSGAKRAIAVPDISLNFYVNIFYPLCDTIIIILVL